MALATVLSRAQNGLAADLVTVEVHLAPGIPVVSIVGLPEAAVRESRDRVKAAITNCGYRFPVNQRVTINLAPADLPKDGARFDLAIALGLLAASDQIPAEPLKNLEILGELALSGEVRPIPGVLPAALKAAAAGRALLLPLGNADEASLARSLTLHAATDLSGVCKALHSAKLPAHVCSHAPTSRALVPDLSEVRGQFQAKRALEVAAAGGHSILMCGPPGSGKSMLAARLPGIQPPLTEDEAIEVASIASAGTGAFAVSQWGLRPYRSPHHSASAVALVGGGGGASVRPGEITLAHLGVLFLDELPEFDRDVLESLREPLESGHITISRAARQADFPARFQLVAAMNPCPCGFLGDTSGKCRCTPDQVARYRARISGPLLDRIDLQITVPRIEREALTRPQEASTESSATIQARVVTAHRKQMNRAGKCNAQLSVKEVEKHCRADAQAKQLLEMSLSRLSLSARGYHRVLKVARTIADLGAAEVITAAHIAEAVRYRELDRAS